MEIRFDGQVVLITGASTGIGAALAAAFGRAGATVVVHYNQSAEAAHSVVGAIEAAGGVAMPVQADLTQADELERLVQQVLERFGRIDVLVNNAGSLIQRSPVEAVSDELYRRIIDTNLTSVFQLCRLVIPAMQRQGRGNIINISSIAARTGGAGGSVLYATAKAAVSTMTRGLAKELVRHNIRVNGVAPGVILTPFHQRFTSQEMLEALVASIPMGRAGAPEECVGPVLFLADDALSSYVTGQIIEVNGGQLMP